VAGGLSGDCEIIEIKSCKYKTGVVDTWPIGKTCTFENAAIPETGTHD